MSTVCVRTGKSMTVKMQKKKKGNKEKNMQSFSTNP
jgi:hypothetical protein